MNDGIFWYSVAIQVLITDQEAGRVKKQKENYLVRAVSVTDAEAKITTFFEKTTIDYRIVNVSESKFIEVIN